MIIRTSAALTLGFTLIACSGTQTVPNTAPPVETEGVAEADDPATEDAEDSTEVEVIEASVAPPAPGDFVVHRFSGTYRDEALMLEKRIIEIEGEAAVVEYVFEEGEGRTTFRVSEIGGDVFAVVRVDGEENVEVPREELDRYMARTFFAPDRNERKLGQESVTVLVGGREVEATKTTFHVTVGDDDAVLTVLRSADDFGRDLGGELVASDGTVLYRAELVDEGSDDAAPAVAKKD